MTGPTLPPPGPRSPSVRTIEVRATSELTLEPDEASVTAGEIVAFRVTNDDTIEHEFVIGDAEEQAAHTGGDHEMEMNGDLMNTISLAAGETGTITWRFEESGTTIAACYVDNHFEAGMTMTINVAPSVENQSRSS